MTAAEEYRHSVVLPALVDPTVAAWALATKTLMTPPPPPQEKSAAGSGPCNYWPLCWTLIDASWWSSSVIEE